MTNRLTGAAGLLALGLLLIPASASAGPLGPMAASGASDVIHTVQYGYGYGRRGYYGRRYYGRPRYRRGRPAFGLRFGVPRGYGYGRGYRRGYGRYRFY